VARNDLPVILRRVRGGSSPCWVGFWEVNQYETHNGYALRFVYIVGKGYEYQVVKDKPKRTFKNNKILGRFDRRDDAVRFMMERKS
jgi:hypothetical protein